MLKKSGYTIKDVCKALGISRNSYYSAKKAKVVEKAKRAKMADFKDGDLVRRIKEIKAEHPFWGYRRVTAWLKALEKA